MRRLIINADDFGLTLGVNRAIEEGHAHGVVTSSTLMAASAGFADAVNIGKRHPTLSIGCHVVLTDGRPVSPPGEVPSLLDQTNGTPVLCRSFASFVARALRGRLRTSDLRTEISAQIRKLHAAGLDVSHVDTHKHVHLFPVIFKPLLEAARECGVHAIRNPFGPVKVMLFAHLMRRARLWTRYSQVSLLRDYEAAFRRTVAEAGMITTDGTFGIAGTDTLDEKLFPAMIGCLPEGTWEFVCHPGYCDSELVSLGGRLRQRREQELRLLTSEVAREVLKRNGVELMSYRELLAAS